MLNLGIAILFASIFWMKMHGHRGLVHPDKPVWKTIAWNDLSRGDTSLANFFQHKSLVHPKTLVWKELTLYDSVNNRQKTIIE